MKDYLDELDLDATEEYEEENNNCYLTSIEKGFELIKKLLTFNEDRGNQLLNLLKLNEIVEGDLLNLMGNINFNEEIELFDKISTLKDKMYEQCKIKLLSKKCVIGIGGKFSAGKSRFINTILNDDILPEDTIPTTSIPTYIVKELVMEELFANTFSDMDVRLDREAVQALTHLFNERYNLGFSHIIRYLLIKTNKLDYDNIILLDTPGYSKDDSTILKESQDEMVAKINLKAADYVIWLIDIENGVINQRDLDFLQELSSCNQILVVFNKCDKVPEQRYKEVIDYSKDLLKDTGLNIFDVIAYSSIEKIEYGSNSIEKFLNEANCYSKHKEDIQIQLEEINYIYENYFKNKAIQLKENDNKFNDIIFRCENPRQLDAIIETKKQTNHSFYNNSLYYKQYLHLYRKLKEILNSI